MRWAVWRLAALALCLGAASCGGGGSAAPNESSSSSSSGSGTSATGPNVVSATVSAGPTGVNAVNTLYTTVTVCVPGTTTCQTIDNIQVDTGSYGLRLLSQALTLTLPVLETPNGAGLVECTEFVDGYSWGPVALVDMQISGESASSVPVQLIGDSRYPTAPSDCSTPAPTAENTIATFGANGILGIGPFAQDCGTYCVSSIPEPAQYYACTTAIACQATTAPLASQVQNPVALFATDNNGTIIALPAVASDGAANVSGKLIFGIDTEANNASSGQTVVPIDGSTGLLTTVFDDETLSDSYVDSGSNATYFNDSSVTACTSANLDEFYCPPSPLTLSAAFVLAGGSTVSENFEVASAETVSDTDTAYPGLAGTNPDPNSFDWGLPFFYGRSVYTAIEGANTSAGTGPYVAF